MTKYRKDTGSGDNRPRCGWCRHPLAPASGPGRPKKFCSQKCRQWDWVSRQRAAELELSENELVVARGELDNLKDLIFVLQCDARLLMRIPTKSRATNTLDSLVTSR